MPYPHNDKEIKEYKELEDWVNELLLNPQDYPIRYKFSTFYDKLVKLQEKYKTKRKIEIHLIKDFI